VDIVDDGRNAFLFNAGDPVSLVSVIDKALAASSMDDPVRLQARQTMLERYRSEYVADRYLQLYQELLP
jgi:glycosyltransferase involved in cell wall biosynthesis